MNVVPLGHSLNIDDFDCGDNDLNKFLSEDAFDFQEKRIANTFVLEDSGKIVAYFCLLNDKISRLEITNSRWRKIKDVFPDSKHFRSYPSIKIGRFAVSSDYRGQNIGSLLMDLLKEKLLEEHGSSAFRFITVDAYLSAIPFYKKNGFVHLKEKDENEFTRLMFFDMMDI